MDNGSPWGNDREHQSTPYRLAAASGRGRPPGLRLLHMQSSHEKLHLVRQKLYRTLYVVPIVLLLLAAGCKSGYQGSARENKTGNKAARQVKTARVEETSQIHLVRVLMHGVYILRCCILHT